MGIVVRLALSLVVFVASDLFTYWMVFVPIVPDEMPGVAELLALIVGLLAAWFVWRKTQLAAKGLFSAIVTGALITGAIGFAGGFFGPLILTPEANQGPLLGLLVTGPLAFLIGAFMGSLWWAISMRRRAPTEECEDS